MKGERDMASKFRGAVDRLRTHLHGTMSDGDFRAADQYLLDVINSIHDDGPDDGEDEGEPMGERLRSGMAPGEPGVGRGGFDARLGYGPSYGAGLDRAMATDRRPRKTPASLKDLLKGGSHRAEYVR
jgi:hypothetical protein